MKVRFEQPTRDVVNNDDPIIQMSHDNIMISGNYLEIPREAFESTHTESFSWLNDIHPEILSLNLYWDIFEEALQWEYYHVATEVSW